MTPASLTSPWRSWRLGGSIFLLALPLSLSAAAYAHLLRGALHDDDLLNLYRIVNQPLLQFLLNLHGSHVLVTRNAVFVLFHSLFGTRAEWYFAVVLLTHLVNVLLLFLVIGRLTARWRLASAVALLWGTCALNEGALGWYSVYGQVLVATVLLWLLHELCLARESPPGPLRVGGWIVLLLAAVTSFASGLAVAFAAPVVAWLILPPAATRRRIVTALAGAAVALAIVFLGTLYMSPRLYGGRDEVQAAFSGVVYWRNNPVMLARLLLFGSTRLVAGPLWTRVPFSTALTAAIELGWLLLVAVAAWSAPRPRRRAILACIVLTVACYGVISVGRSHLLRTIFVPSAELLRYHYVAVIPLALLLALALAQVADQLAALAARGGDWRRRASAVPARMPANGALVAWGVLIAGVLARYGAPHPPEFSGAETANALRTIRSRIYAAAPGETVYIANSKHSSMARFVAPADFPGWAALFAIHFPANVVDGRRVVFVDDDPAVLAAASRGRRSAMLIEAPRSEGKSGTSP